MKPKSRRERFLEKYGRLTDKEKLEIALYMSKEMEYSQGKIKADVPYSWSVVYYEVHNETNLSKKMLNKLKHEGKI